MFASLLTFLHLRFHFALRTVMFWLDRRCRRGGWWGRREVLSLHLILWSHPPPARSQPLTLSECDFLSLRVSEHDLFLSFLFFFLFLLWVSSEFDRFSLLLCESSECESLRLRVFFLFVERSLLLSRLLVRLDCFCCWVAAGFGTETFVLF